eukprot:CAMPEP_0114314252 /NCGR_PEP_ID=MMETSP0059-20121206/21671_1 /TAXON_ID=36894 /ORGANISM="Pyramimonas parkeae, Strain CCMP726" /LENGTH=56 /DNA_ID=CAMNT_0001439305 /DNA_START=643 /DNA_END=809 /DNA_ORIENTATION=+
MEVVMFLSEPPRDKESVGGGAANDGAPVGHVAQRLRASSQQVGVSAQRDAVAEALR